MLKGVDLVDEGGGVTKGRILRLIDSSAKWTLRVRTSRRWVFRILVVNPPRVSNRYPQLMVMEAMRLSLIDHEQQQQRQREEEERGRRNGETSERGRSTEAGHSAGLTIPSSGQRSSSVVLPEPIGERIDHRPSLSVPTNNVLGDLHLDEGWRRNPPQFSTLGAALDAATTAVAIPLSSSTTQTGATDGDTGTISSESSETGRSSVQPTPDPVDGVEGANYFPLPSSPESPGQPHSLSARTGDDEATTNSSSRTHE